MKITALTLAFLCIGCCRYQTADLNRPSERTLCGKPVVVMECGGCNFVIPDNNYGLIARKFDIDDMSKMIIYLINNKNILEKISKNGRKRILENFSVEKVALKIYNSLLD